MLLYKIKRGKPFGNIQESFMKIFSASLNIQLQSSNENNIFTSIFSTKDNINIDAIERIIEMSNTKALILTEH